MTLWRAVLCLPLRMTEYTHKKSLSALLTRLFPVTSSKEWLWASGNTGMWLLIFRSMEMPHPCGKRVWPVRTTPRSLSDCECFRCHCRIIFRVGSILFSPWSCHCSLTMELWASYMVKSEKWWLKCWENYTRRVMREKFEFSEEKLGKLGSVLMYFFLSWNAIYRCTASTVFVIFQFLTWRRETFRVFSLMLFSFWQT